MLEENLPCCREILPSSKLTVEWVQWFVDDCIVITWCWVYNCFLLLGFWCYRDLKPGNVMLSDRGTPVIMDFGSMAVAKMEIKGRSQAVALQVTIKDLQWGELSFPWFCYHNLTIVDYWVWMGGDPSTFHSIIESWTQLSITGLTKFKPIRGR